MLSSSAAMATMREPFGSASETRFRPSVLVLQSSLRAKRLIERSSSPLWRSVGARISVSELRLKTA